MKWAFLGAAVAGALVVAAGAGGFSLRDLFDNSKDTQEAAVPAAAPVLVAQRTEPPQTAKPPISGTVTIEAIAQAARVLPEPKRKQLLDDKAAFRRFVEEEAARQSVLAAAEANNFQARPNVAYLMRRQAEQLLVDGYLKVLLANRIPADFPSEDQMRAHYEKNKENFIVAERVSAWQIFLPLKADADDKMVKRVEAEARAIIKRIKGNKLNFWEAARKHSAHAASRANGGYMGLLSVTELVPELRERLLKLKEGELGGPFRGPGGVHILKRGARIPAETLVYEQVKGRIRDQARLAAVQKLRQEAVTQIRKKYGQPLSADTVEAWRGKIRGATVQATAAAK